MKMLLLALLFSFSALALPPETQLIFKGRSFSHFTNQDLLAANPNIEKAIITIHGSERNSSTYYNSVEAMSRKVGMLEKTIVISPHFKEVQDEKLENEFFFDPEGWLSGDEDLKLHEVSSFEILDYMISLLADKKSYPNLKTIFITGHSAGGQLVQRYAAGSVLDQTYPDIHFRYVVANPGSYMYLTANRPFAGDAGCAYNNYKFGLDNLNRYMQQLPKPELISAYLKKDVVYFLGEADTRSDDIDQSCPAVYQGHTRLERGRSFKEQLSREFPQETHQIYSVPGVGHTQYGMYTSELGLKVLFQKL